MFSYQCRYCKASFDHWEKLVKHRTETHRKEFEALKAQAAASQFVQRTSENMESTNRRWTTPFEGEHRMSVGIGNQTSSTNSIRVPQRTSKEVNASDLENQEIRLCIPPQTPRSTMPGIQLPSTSNGFPSPPESPEHSHLNLFRRCTYHKISPNYLTPPISPSRSTSSSLNGEIVLNMNWVDPACSNAVVMYHEINDSDEIEICTTPSTATGSRISVTRHSFPESPTQDQNRGEGSQWGMNHVVIEELDDELQMTCSNMANGNVRDPFSATNRNKFDSYAINRNNKLKSRRKKEDHCYKSRPLHGTSNSTSVVNARINGKAFVRRGVVAYRSFRNSSKLRVASRASLQRSRLKYGM